MPVTIRLSKLFHDRLGEEIADELVDWFNAVDATYRGDLKELNELNFARFDAKLEQRAAALDAKIEQRITEVRADFRERIAELRSEMRDQRAELIKWMFIIWASTIVPLAGLMIALQKL